MPAIDRLAAAHRELGALTARAAELRAFIQTETSRRRKAAYQARPLAGTGEPCDWCGDNTHTVAEHHRWVYTGRFVCRWPGPCRLAWIAGITPEQFKAERFGRTSG